MSKGDIELLATMAAQLDRLQKEYGNEVVNHRPSLQFRIADTHSANTCDGVDVVKDLNVKS